MEPSYPFTPSGLQRFCRDWGKMFPSIPKKDVYNQDARNYTLISGCVKIDIVELERIIDAEHHTESAEMSLEEKIKTFYGVQAAAFVEKLL